MKVLHVIPSLSPALGGPTKVALNIVKAIRTQGIDAEIVTTNHHVRGILDVPLNQRVEYKGVPVWFLPVSHSIKEYIFSSALTKWLWQHIDNYDILDNHYLFSYAPTCAAAIARFKNIPYTVRTQGQLTSWALQQSPLKKQLYAALIENQNLKQAAAIHCTTTQEAIDLGSFGISTPTITLPLGVEPPAQLTAARTQLQRLLNIPNERQILLFLSRLHPKKRPDLLIDSFKKVVANNHNCHLIIAGSGEDNYVNYLQQLIPHNLRDRVSFTGFVTGDRKNIFLQGSDIFVLPSYSENFGIAVAEAMAAKLPVIITPEVQIATDITAANAGITVNNKTELTNAIVRLLESPQMRSRLSQNAVELASQKYVWHRIASQLIVAYGELLKE